MDADLVISFKVFRERFTSRVVLWPDTKKIDTEYLDGPFKKMVSNWAFEDTDTGCNVHFDVDFEFKNAILQKIIGVVFNEAMTRVVRAFEKRAAELYGAQPFHDDHGPAVKFGNVAVPEAAADHDCGCRFDWAGVRDRWRGI